MLILLAWLYDIVDDTQKWLVRIDEFIYNEEHDTFREIVIMLFSLINSNQPIQYLLFITYLCVMKIYIWVITVIVTLYLAWAFYNVSFNIADWNHISRYCVSLFSTLSVFVWLYAKAIE